MDLKSEASFSLNGIVSLVSLTFAAIFLGGCLEQYDPGPHRKQIAEERQMATRTMPRLNKDGSLPQAGGAEEVVDAGQMYSIMCTSCHGANGAGDGPGGAALNPKPRDFTDKAWQKSVDDARIEKVLRQGGASVGLSATMAALGAGYSDAEMKAMIEKVRSFGN